MYYVYIITNKRNTVLYTGVTNNLIRRMYEHRNELLDGFSKRYHLHKLVYFDTTTDIKEAIAMEKKIRGWVRAKKENLIEDQNPNWEDLSLQFLDSSPKGSE